jgi:phosphoribosylformylglycinamidine synthase I
MYLILFNLFLYLSLRSMKVGVITFPGSNCDQDMVDVLQQQFNQQIERLWHKDHDLKGVDLVILPGGFSYGDYLRSGAIARFSPIMKEVIDFAAKGGYVMGICNGFQILCESGLLPGALLHNLSKTFICKNVYIKAVHQNSILTKKTTHQALKIPIAHGEGRYYIDQDGLKQLQDQQQILFQYCSSEGIVNETSNPNGSLLNIAGISNQKGNVVGMMPHPERAADEILKNTDGKLLFESILGLVRA